jgi:hypothetical protein
LREQADAPVDFDALDLLDAALVGKDPAARAKLEGSAAAELAARKLLLIALQSEPEEARKALVDLINQSDGKLTEAEPPADALSDALESVSQTDEDYKPDEPPPGWQGKQR